MGELTIPICQHQYLAITIKKNKSINQINISNNLDKMQKLNNASLTKKSQRIESQCTKL